MKKTLVIIIALLISVVFASAGFAQDKINLPTATPPPAGAPEKVTAPKKATPEKKAKKTKKNKKQESKETSSK